MAIEAISLEQIHDNPYQTRAIYHRKDIDELAHSIKTHGLLQVPPGRRKNGDIELGFGHLRMRAFTKLAKKEPKKFGKMPVDIRDLSDEQMAMFALEENLKRRDISPMELARAVDKYLESFLEKTEVELAESLNMTKGNISNMRRVLRLPAKILEKIDEGRINFTQGRELLILERVAEDPLELMRTAIRGLRTESGSNYYGHSNTVEGMMAAVHDVISSHCRPLDKAFEGYRYDLLFDTRAAGCLECDKMVRSHPTKSGVAHYCTDAECWDRHQEEQREKAAASAKAKMEAEVISRATQALEEEKAPAPEPEPVAIYTMEKRGSSWIAIDGQGRIIAIADDRELAEITAKASFEPVTTEVNPAAFTLNHTYRFCEKPESRKLEVFDVTAQDLATGAEALGVDRENIEQVKVHKSSGKLGTGGYVSAGWSKCTETLFSPEVAAVEEQLEVQVSERERITEEIREAANLSRPVGELPCETCLKGETCERAYFHVADDDSGRLICEQWELPSSSTPATAEDLEELEVSERIAAAPAPAAAAQEIPDDILTRAKAAAGTRAEVLDLLDICSGDRFYRQYKQGYADLSGDLRFIDDPEECLERCTHGFHYAFDSKADNQQEICVCSDPQCLSKKKAAHTRKVNAEGQARKKAEVKAVKQAIELVGQVASDGKQLLDEGGKFTNALVIPRSTLKLILLAQIKGKHTSRYSYGEKLKLPDKWLWDKISPGTPENERTLDKLFKERAAIDKLTVEELARLVTEFMFYNLMDHGDLGTYQFQVKEPLEWMGIEMELPQEVATE